MNKPEPRRAASQIGRSYRGVAWHGPSILETLEGVDEEKASARPHPELHTIWELVQHLTAWHKVATRAILGGSYVSLTGEDDWPPVQAGGWPAALSELAKASADLVEAVRQFPEDRLGDLVPGKEFDYYFLLHGIAQHNTYHAGQIAILKRL
jgi:uncharacterized damage-inducible protein DinB